MLHLIKSVVFEEQAQDLVEYTLLLAFVCLASAAIFIGAGTTMAGIWTTTNTALVSANSAAAATT